MYPVISEMITQPVTWSTATKLQLIENIAYFERVQFPQILHIHVWDIVQSVSSLS